MEMYKEYLQEYHGLETFENEYGFATYSIKGNECYIRDIFVKKEFRNKAAASKIADVVTMLAKRRDCTILSGTVDLNAKTATISMQVLAGYGMRFIARNNDMLIFGKEI